MQTVICGTSASIKKELQTYLNQGYKVVHLAGASQATKISEYFAMDAMFVVILECPIGND